MDKEFKILEKASIEDWKKTEKRLSYLDKQLKTKRDKMFEKNLKKAKGDYYLACIWYLQECGDPYRGGQYLFEKGFELGRGKQ